jgi:proteasome lid subunit RPN8/RPN11
MDSETLDEFVLPGASWRIRFSAEATSVMKSHRQARWDQCETVGQLFSPNLTDSTIHISLASILSRVRASRTSVTFDPEEAAQQRDSMLAKRLYCIGLWHTHPESNPTPSGTDEQLAGDHAKAASPLLNGLCFVIVGTGASQGTWYVGFHDGEVFHRAQRA